MGGQGLELNTLWLKVVGQEMKCNKALEKMGGQMPTRLQRPCLGALKNEFLVTGHLSAFKIDWVQNSFDPARL